MVLTYNIEKDIIISQGTVLICWRLDKGFDQPEAAHQDGDDPCDNPDPVVELLSRQL